WAKWSAPTIANGKVYLATFDNVLNVYGLLTSGDSGILLAFGDSSSAPGGLTHEGTVDWVHWGDTSVQRKGNGASMISSYTVVSGPELFYNNDPRQLGWTAGARRAHSGGN